MTESRHCALPTPFLCSHSHFLMTSLLFVLHHAANHHRQTLRVAYTFVVLVTLMWWYVVIGRCTCVCCAMTRLNRRQRRPTTRLNLILLNGYTHSRPINLILSMTTVTHDQSASVSQWLDSTALTPNHYTEPHSLFNILVPHSRNDYAQLHSLLT